MRVLIIEDEAPAFRRLQKILEDIETDIEIIEVIDSVEESVKWLNNHNPPDLIFMDIQLSDGLSFEIFDKVVITKPVIFTTAFDEYMLKAFKVNSVDYLLKPIRPEDLNQSLQKYHQMKSFYSDGDAPDLNSLISKIQLNDKKYKSRFLIKQGDQLFSIESDNIACFQSRNGLVYLSTKQGKNHIIDHTLDDLTSLLDPEAFCRANRQFIIQFDAIQTAHKYHKGKLLVKLSIETSEPITISSEKATAFKQWLGDS